MVLDLDRAPRKSLGLLTGLVGLTACACLAPVTVTEPSEAAYREALDGVVLVQDATLEHACSGVRTHFGILTAGHCWRDDVPIVVSLPDTPREVAELRRIDPDRDLALLTDPLPPGPVRHLRQGDMRVGERGFVVGHPLQLFWTAHEAVVTNERRLRGHWQQIRAGIAPGFSGAPLLDRSGRVACIVDSMGMLEREGDLPAPIPDLGFCAPASELALFLEGL